MNEEASPSGPSTSRSVRVDAGVVRVYERGEDDARTLVTEVFTAALADAAVAEAFVREARALAALAHPRVPRAVVTVLGEGKVADAARVSQPIPPGAKLLDEETARGRRYSAVDLEALFRDAMTTLDELHRLLPPLVHGNVHPGALVVTRGSDVSFVDFDLGTRAIARRPEPHGYEAPELSRGAAATGAADVYGVALVVACLAAGVGPARLPRDARGRFVVAGGLSPRLSAAVAACLDPTPARRPTAAGALQVLTRGPSLLLRARRSSVRPVFALALGATLVAAPLAVRATKRTPPPAPASAFVVAGPTPTAPLGWKPLGGAALDKVDDAPPDIPSTTDRDLEWNGVVSAAGPGDAPVGTACTLQAKVTRTSGVVPLSCVATLRCGHHSTIEQATMTSCSLEEISEPFVRYRYEMRGVMRNEAEQTGRMVIDTRAGLVRFKGGEGHDITVKVERASHPVDQARFLDQQRFERPLERRGKITVASGEPPAALGSECVVSVAPHAQGASNCSVAMSCGGKVIYKNDAATCSVCNGFPEALADTTDAAVDGTPRLAWTRGAQVVVGDDGAHAAYELKVTMKEDPIDGAFATGVCDRSE